MCLLGPELGPCSQAKDFTPGSFAGAGERQEQPVQMLRLGQVECLQPSVRVKPVRSERWLGGETAQRGPHVWQGGGSASTKSLAGRVAWGVCVCV